MQQAQNNIGIDCIKLSGVLDAQNSGRLQRELETALAQSQGTLFVADMSEVESIDSDGLIVLLSALNFAQKHGKSFALKGITPSAQIVLEVTKLDQVFDVVDDVIAPQPDQPIAVAA